MTATDTAASAELIRAYYRDRLARYGDTVEAVGWTSENQRRRFELLTDRWDLQHADVLDLGCGRGDLALWLRASDIPHRYYGIDVVPEFVEIATRRGLRCQEGDLATCDLPPCDYAVLSGVFNLEATTPEQMLTILRRTVAVCRKGLAFDCLSTWHPTRVEGQRYYAVEEIVKIGLELLPFSVLRVLHHDPVGNLIVQVNRKEG